jgi:hypothetical protein
MLRKIRMTPSARGAGLDPDRQRLRAGPWLVSLDHSGVIAEIDSLSPSPESGLGVATFMLANLTELHAALDRVYKLAVSLPEGLGRRAADCRIV